MKTDLIPIPGNVKKLSLLLGLLMLIVTVTDAQVNVVTTVTTVPASTGSINICSGQTHVVTTFTNQSGSALTGIVIHQAFPSGMTALATVSQNGCGITWDQVASTYTLNLPDPTPCTIDILADISCAVQPDPATNLVTITNTSSTHSITPSPNTATFSVTAPQLGIIDFYDDRTPQQSIPLPVNGAAQQLVIFKDVSAPQLVRFRQFDIKVTDGVADNFTLTLSSSNPALASEVEIQHTSYFALQGIDVNGQAVNPPQQYQYTYTNPTPPAPALAQIHVGQNVIHDLFGSTHDELLTLERIRVFEYFYVVACSPPTEDGTVYTVDWACAKQVVQPCSTAVENRTIHVEASKSWVGMTVTVDPPFEICTTPTSPTSNIIYKFTNPLNTGRPKGSGTKTLHTITIPINDSWLTPGYSVYLRDPNSNSPDVDVTVSNFYSNSNGVITLDFDALVAAPFSGNGDALRDDFIRNNIFNEFGEDESFELVLKDVKFLCNNGQFYLSNNTFSSCTKTGNEVMLDGTAPFYYHDVDYDDMCDASVPIRNLPHTYGNYFPVTSFVEADKTDLHSGDPFVAVDLYYQYTGWVDVANISPFKFLYPPGPQDDIINCNNNVTYRAVVSLSPLYIIHNTYYYPDPNNSNNQIVTLNPIGPDLVIAGNQLYEITGLDKNGKINFNLELNLDPTVCPLNTGGKDELRFSLEAICDGCTTCAYVFACQEQILYHHCQGECSGPPQSTSSFAFDRSTFGWTTSAMTTAANANTSGVRLNRTYPCDIITVESKGSIAHINTGFQKATTLSYFIEYDSPQADSYQFFNFEDGTLEYTPKDGALQTLTLTSADVDVNSHFDDNVCTAYNPVSQQIESVPCSLKVNLNFPSGVLSALQDTGAKFKLVMNLSVKPMMTIPNNTPISWPDPGYYLIPQVRGQYISDMGNSCDDWGDNMMTMNLGVSEYNEIVVDGMSGYSAGLCGKYFIYQTTVTGGLNGLDDFPSEFRPVMKWPEWNATNPIKLELPSSGLNTVYQLSSTNFTYDGNLYPAVTSGGTGPVITFDGYDDNGVTKPWPVIENDGKPTKMEIYGRITNECPVPFGTPTQQIPTYKMYFPYQYRAYTSGIPNVDAGCSFTNPEPDQLPYKVSESYSLNLQRDHATINVYSSVSTINNLKLNIDHQAYGNMNLDHVWLHFNESGYHVTAVRVNNVAVQSATITLAGNPWVFWKLGIINEVYTYNISIDLELTSCVPNTPLTVSAETGFNCFDYPTNANPASACSPTYTQSFTIVPQNSKINLNVTGANPNSGPICNSFLYTAKITSSLPGDVEDPVLEITLPSGLSIASTTFKLNGTGTATSITPVLVSGKWTYYLNPAAFNNNGIPGNNLVWIELYIMVKGDCNMAGQTSGTITFHAAGKNICLTPISDEDDDDEYLVFDSRTVVTNTVNNQICSGSSIQLTAPSGPVYLWSNGMTTQSIQASATGTYTVTVSDCCPLSVTTFNLTVYSNPAAAITGGNVSCNGAAVTLTSSAGTSYSWSTGASTQSIQATAGTYTVTVTDSHGCTGTKSKTITSGTTPTVSITPNGPTLFCDGGSVLLTSTSGASYLWSTGATTQGIYAVTQATYTVTMTNAAGCTASASMSTTVLPNPPVTVSANGPVTFCEGGSVILTSSSANQYLWSSGETTQSITVTTSGSFYVTGTNAYGCLSSSGWITVTVESCNEEVGFCMHVERLNSLDYGREVIETDDGGYAIAAGLFDNECDRDLYFLKYDPQSVMDINCLLGDLQKGCVGSYMDEARSVVQRNEIVNGQTERFYYIAGSVFLSQTNHDIVVAKIAENGTPVWSYRFRSNSGTDRIEEGMKIIDLYPLCSDHLLIVGYTNSYEENPANYDMFALQMRSNGTIAQFKTFGNAGTTEKAYDAVLLNNNNGCIIAGEIKYESNSDMLAIKINGKIDKQADMVVHGESDEAAYAVTASEEHVYLAGKTNTFGQSGGYDVFLVETDYSLSTISSTNTYGQRDVNEVAYDIIRTESGDLVMTGAVEKDDDDGLVLKTTSAGALAWSIKTSFENHDDRFYSITEMNHNYDLIASGMYNVSGHDDDIFISKITADGNSCCLTPYSMETGSGGTYENTGSEWTKPLSRVSYNNYQTYYEEEFLCGEQEAELKLDGGNAPESLYHLYPNPAHAAVTFSASPDLDLTDAALTLYDVMGKVVCRYPMYQVNSITIGLEQFPPGVYLLRFTDNGIQLFQSRLVKN